VITVALALEGQHCG